jgi:orotidine-5'-phosphate decarboxylase
MRCWSYRRLYQAKLGFFVQYGWRGLQVLEKLVAFINKAFPNIVVILDMKVGDIGETNRAYVRTAFDELGGDAITIHPYLGKEANNPFLDRADKGIIVLCHTSNPGAGEFQHLHVGENDPLFLKVASNVSTAWNHNGNCSLVTGATFPAEIAKVREVAPTPPLLIPGIGKQGGDLAASVKAAKFSGDGGFIINASSSIFGAADPGRAAADLNEGTLSAYRS